MHHALGNEYTARSRHEDRLSRAHTAFAARATGKGRRRARCPLSALAARLAARRRSVADASLTLSGARS